MHKLLLVIQREYIVRVRTKAFIIFTIITPLFMAAMVILPSMLMMRSSGTHHLVIVAADNTLAEAMKTELTKPPDSGDDQPKPAPDAKKAEEKAPAPAFEVTLEGPPTEDLRQQLTTRVRNNALDGFAWLEADAPTTRKATYYSRGGANLVEGTQVYNAFSTAIKQRALADHGFTPEQAKTLLGGVDLQKVHIDKQGAKDSNGIGAFFLPFILVMALYMTVLIYGIYVMRSVIEEKSSRIVEVLLGSVTPMQLMAGKIIGVGAVGITQILVWAAAGSVLGTGSFAVMGKVMGDSMKGAHIAWPVLIFFPIYFLIGYLTYASLYAAIGAMVNSDEEAQQMQFPVTLPLIACVVLASSIINDPNSTVAFWFSMFPLTSPIIMFVRVAQGMPPMWQMVLSLSMSLATLYGLIWLTSRIYRVGILMYGKRPTLPEIVKWIRYS